MLPYLLRRLLFAAFLVFAVSSAALVVTRLAPGDYVTQNAPLDASQETKDAMRARYGLERRPVARNRIGRPLLFENGAGHQAAEIHNKRIARARLNR